MAAIFYDHLINWPKLMDSLDALDLDRIDRIELIEHSEHLLHTEILIVVISHLPEHKHSEFLDLFHAAPYDPKHLAYVRQHSQSDVERAIQQRSEEVIEEILRELLED